MINRGSVWDDLLEGQRWEEVEGARRKGDRRGFLKDLVVRSCIILNANGATHNNTPLVSLLQSRLKYLQYLLELLLHFLATHWQLCVGWWWVIDLIIFTVFVIAIIDFHVDACTGGASKTFNFPLKLLQDHTLATIYVYKQEGLDKYPLWKVVRQWTSCNNITVFRNYVRNRLCVFLGHNVSALSRTMMSYKLGGMNVLGHWLATSTYDHTNFLTQNNWSQMAYGWWFALLRRSILLDFVDKLVEAM